MRLSWNPDKISDSLIEPSNGGDCFAKTPISHPFHRGELKIRAAMVIFR
jgi:hypothetical protein